jgi:hypothetical protein
MPGEQPAAGAAPNPPQIPAPLEVAPAPPPVAPVQASMVAAGGDHCPGCNAAMAADQRYCLECGQRRGDPRLPFMDAVVFMDAVKRPDPGEASPPPPPGEPRPRWSANASLIAGIATLILAIGVGVLIGQSGNGGTTSAANPAPQIIRVGGSGSGEESPSPTTTSEPEKGGKKEGGKSKKAAKAKGETGSSGASKASEEILKPKVKQLAPTTQIGEKCEKGAAGCGKSGKFEGEFFGE